MKRFGSAWVGVLAVCLALGACKSTDTKSSGGDGGLDGGGTDASAGKDAGGQSKDAGGGATDAGGGKDGGKAKDAGVVVDDAGNSDDAGAAQTFHVPAAGGKFNFKSLSGAMVTFDFPASAGGKDITVTPVDPSSVTFANATLGGSFGDVIELGPSGTTFSTPVKVTVGQGALMVMNFHDPNKPGDPLLLSADGKSLELTHFSTLGIVSPGLSCQSASGWHDQADQGGAQQACSGQGSATTYRSYGCKQLQFCYVITASCCVDPTSTNTDCQLGDKALQLQYLRTGSNGGQYLYCDLPGGTGSRAYVQSISPSMLAASSTDQEITLTGTGFVQGGSVVINGDLEIATTFVDATTITGTVPGASVTASGTLPMVGYIPPSASATGACDSAHTSNCDFANRSNTIDLTIL